jgi:hypothetical protein
MLRFRVQIKVLWPGTQKYKGLDSLVPFTCEKPAYCVLYLIASEWRVSYKAGFRNRAILAH